MVRDHQADGPSVGGERCKRCRKKMKIKRKMIQTSASLLFLLPSNYHYGKKNTYSFALFVSLSH